MKFKLVLMNLFLTLGVILFTHAQARCEDSSLQKLKSRFEVIGEIFYFDSSGKHLLAEGAEWRSWKPRAITGNLQIESQWSSDSKQGESFAVHHSWTIENDGSIKVLIEEYGKTEEIKTADGQNSVNFTNLLKKEETILKDFAPVTWISVKPGQARRVVIRFTPRLSKDKEIKQLTELPISGTSVLITDNEGNLWTENNDMSGKYVGFTTHNGSIFISYYPFQGASEMGFASGHKIELRLAGKKTATLTSQTAFLPEDVRATVYGIYRPLQRTGRTGSTHTRTSSKEEPFLKAIQEQEKQ